MIVVLRIFPYLALLLIGFFIWGPTGFDDAFITYWSAKQLALSGFIGNINGDLVEQSSSLLHVVLLAALYKISAVNLADLGVYFSLTMALACLLLMQRLATLLQLKKPCYPIIFLVFSANFSYWAMGGLESTLSAFVLLLWAISSFLFLTRTSAANRVVLFFTTLAYLLVRPESYFVLLAALLAFAVFCYLSQDIQVTLKKWLVLFLLSSLLFIAIAAIRYHVYGQVFPQPVYAKASSLSIDKFINGLKYFLFSGQPSIIIYSLFTLYWAVIFLKTRRIHLLPALLLSLALAQLAFVISSGGDWMSNGRFFVPIMPFFIALFFYYLQSMPRLAKPLGVAMLLLMISETLILPHIVSTGIRLQSIEPFYQRLEQPLALNHASWVEKANLVNLDNYISAQRIAEIIDALPIQEKPIEILAVNMGLIPYHLRSRFASNVHFTDLYGLLTQDITQCPALAQSKGHALGVVISYHDYFQALQSHQCQLAKPDIIYDKNFNRRASRFLQSQQYHVVYQQTGDIKTYAWFYLHGDSFIAVSPELYKKLPASLQDQSYTFTYKNKTNL